MRKNKRIFAILVALLMVSAMVVPASAASIKTNECGLADCQCSSCDLDSYDCVSAGDCGIAPTPREGEIWWFKTAEATNNANCGTANTNCGKANTTSGTAKANCGTANTNCGTANTNCGTTNTSCGTPSTPSCGTPTTPSSGTPSTPPSETPSGDTSSTASELEVKMVSYVNAERVAAGLAPLKINDELTLVARTKAQDMIDDDYFSHTSPTYGSPFDMMKSFGVSYRTAGENIAINSSVEGAHTAFMNSQGHRENILKSSYTEIGIGIAKNAGGRVYVSQMFIG